MKATRTIGGVTTTYYLYDSRAPGGERARQTAAGCPQGPGGRRAARINWNVNLEHDGTAYTRRLTWGLDLSGSLQGAGGVGGLLCLSELNASGSVTKQRYPLYDGNGNVVGLLKPDGTVAATYRYDAFGQTLATTGPPEDCDYRFSAKPQDPVTGLYYYGHRYYDPVTGRWPYRDPIEEQGGFNLYGFVENDNINGWDFRGLWGEVTRINGSKQAVVCSTSDEDTWDTLAKKIDLKHSHPTGWRKKRLAGGPFHREWAM